MIKINYDVHLGCPNSTTEILVAPMIDPAYITLIEHQRGFLLQVPPYGTQSWQWLYSAIRIQSLEEKQQYLAVHTIENTLMVREVVNHSTPLSPEVYEVYAKEVFSAFRCSWWNPEMTTKVYGQFVSAEWAEAQYILGGVIPIPHKTLLTCNIEPLYATIQSSLSSFEGKRKKHWDVKTWKPKDPMNYQVVWHLMITLSNGEKYKMYYPICSLNKWYETMQHYFTENPTALFTPLHYRCGVTNHPSLYSYEAMMNQIQFFADLTVGFHPAEILIKLSAFFYDPNRASYLQTLLTDHEVELVFSGKVLWS